MSGKPILFNTEMVRATICDLKNQTRRLNGLKKINEDPDRWNFKKLYNNINKKEIHAWFERDYNVYIHNEIIKCPWYIGQKLWVRETWVNSGIGIYYRASYDGEIEWKWKPSIHMPKKYARIWLKITDIRVERVQDITRQDAVKEGICIYDPEDTFKGYQANRWPEENFQVLWDLINKKRGYGWDLNPWVYVIEFKKILKD